MALPTRDAGGNILLGNLVINVISNVTEVSNAVVKLKKSFETAAKGAKTLEEALKAVNRAGGFIVIAINAILAVSRKLIGVFQTIARGVKTAVVTSFNILIGIIGKVSKAVIGLATGGIPLLGNVVTQLAKKFDTIGRRLTSFGIQAGSVGAVLTAAISIPLREAIGVGADFAQQLKETENIATGTGKSMRAEFVEIRKVILDLAAVTKFTATEVANASRLIVSSGKTTKNEILAILPAAIDLAAAIGTDVETATRLAVSGFASFVGSVKAGATQTERATETVDILTNAVLAAQIEFGDLSSFMTTLGGSIFAFNISARETLSVFGAVNEVMNNGAQAATGLNAAILGLETIERLGKKTSEKLKKSLDAVGLTVGDIKPSVVGLDKAFKNLAIAQLDTATINTILQRRGLRVFQIFEKMIPRVDEIGSKMMALGTASRIAADNMDTLKGTMLIVVSQLERLKIVITDALDKNGLRDLLKDIQALIGRMAEWVKVNEKLVARIVKFALGLGTVVSLLGASSAFMGVMLQLFTLLSKVLILNAVKLTIFGTILASIIVLFQDGVIDVRDFIKEFKEGVNNFIIPAALKFKTAIIGMRDQLKAFGLELFSVFLELGAKTDSLGESVAKLAASMIDAATAAVEWIKVNKVLIRLAFGLKLVVASVKVAIDSVIIVGLQVIKFIKVIINNWKIAQLFIISSLKILRLEVAIWAADIANSFMKILKPLRLLLKAFIFLNKLSILNIVNKKLAQGLVAQIDAIEKSADRLEELETKLKFFQAQQAKTGEVLSKALSSDELNKTIQKWVDRLKKQGGDLDILIDNFKKMMLSNEELEKLIQDRLDALGPTFTIQELLNTFDDIANKAKSKAKEAMDAFKKAVETARKSAQANATAIVNAVAAAGNKSIAILKGVSANLDSALGDFTVLVRKFVVAMTGKGIGRAAQMFGQITQSLDTMKNALTKSADELKGFGIIIKGVSSENFIAGLVQRIKQLETRLKLLNSEAFKTLSSGKQKNIIQEIQKELKELQKAARAVDIATQRAIGPEKKDSAAALAEAQRKTQEALNKINAELDAKLFQAGVIAVEALSRGMKAAEAALNTELAKLEGHFGFFGDFIKLAGFKAGQDFKNEFLKGMFELLQELQRMFGIIGGLSAFGAGVAASNLPAGGASGGGNDSGSGGGTSPNSVDVSGIEGIRGLLNGGGETSSTVNMNINSALDGNEVVRVMQRHLRRVGVSGGRI